MARSEVAAPGLTRNMITAVGTVAVVVAEFLALTAIYQRPVPVRNQLQVVERLAGQPSQTA
ncbi:MAG: hypothetical protein M0Z30_00700 [Actinomycetota bacterium]|nr:hypothetical protein [Actinomycetota bacterium]